MSRPSDCSLVRAIVADLVRDVRCSEGRDADMPGMIEYAQKCRSEVAAIFRKRHGLRVDRFGQVSP